MVAIAILVQTLLVLVPTEFIIAHTVASSRNCTVAITTTYVHCMSFAVKHVVFHFVAWWVRGFPCGTFNASCSRQSLFGIDFWCNLNESDASQ